MADILLIHPPVSKPCEPPAGIAKLAGALLHHHVTCRIVDANYEAMESMLDLPCTMSDTWSRRAFRQLPAHRAAIRQWHLYHNSDRYRRVIKDLNRMYECVSRSSGARVTLSNYQEQRLSPLSSGDCIAAAAHPEASIFFPYFSNRLTGLLTDEEPSHVGVSINYLSQVLPAFAMIGFIRRLSPRTKIIFGGGLITSWMSTDTWREPFTGLVDECVSGPGEDKLLSFMGSSNGTRDEHIRPAYDSFDGHRYMAPGAVLPYSASRGCYWNRCTFCPEHAEGAEYSPIAVDTVISDIEALVTRCRPRLIHFLDNAMSPALLSAIAAVPLGAPWYGFARISDQLADPEFCRDLKRSGCVMLQLGIESGDQGVIDALAKGIEVETAARTLTALKKSGIAAYVYLLFGTPAESFAEAKKTLEFVVEHREEIGFLNLAVFNLPAYGPDAETLQTKEFYAGDLSLYRQFVHPKGWDRHHVRQFLDREFKRNSAVSAILRQDPPSFTSNHAPFFVMAGGE